MSKTFQPGGGGGISDTFDVRDSDVRDSKVTDGNGSKLPFLGRVIKWRNAPSLGGGTN